MNCKTCGERIEFDEMAADFIEPGTDLLKNGEVVGRIENGREYCIKCWGLR